MDTTKVILWIVFGSIGMGYFVYGKKQKKAIAFLAGLGLMFLPYAVGDPLTLGLVSVSLMAIPFFLRY